MVSTVGTNPSLATDLRRVIAEIDRMVPISDVQTLQQSVDTSVSEPRFRLLLVGGFAVVACLLAMLGVYAVMALTVSRRTHDIGIRMALGAGHSTVRRQVVVDGMQLAVTGAVVGLVGALGASQLIAAMLYGVEPTDPLTFASVLIVTLLVAGAACYLPARRASRLDPLAALRSD
jgi:putative ABC transport system permease protein